MGIPLNIDWQQILLHVFNFVILVGGLYFLLYNPIRKFIAKREEHYRKLDEEANAKLASAQKYDAEAKARFESAGNEIREKRMEAETKLNSYIAAQMKEADAKAEKLVADAKKAAQEQKQEILDSAKKDILLLTREAAIKIISPDTDEAYRRFLDAAERDEDHDE